jgi:hypothetical protein
MAQEMLWSDSGSEFDPDADERRRLLAGVAERLARAGLRAEYRPLERYLDFYGGPPAGTTGLVCKQPASTGAAQVTIVRVRRLLPPGEGGLAPDRRSWVRDLDVTYELSADGELAYEVTMLEDPDDGLGHSRATSAQRELTDDMQAVVDALTLWHSHRDMIRCQPPAPPDQHREARRLRREFDGRDAAAAAAAVQVDVDPDGAGVPVDLRAGLAADVAALDAAALCWQFPRDRTGRYARNAVVALAGYPHDPSRRGPWLAARAEGDQLVVSIEALIGANQRHRWDATRWLWDRRHAGTPPVTRWQLDDPAAAAAYTDLLDRHQISDALERAGASVDTDLAALLSGYPTRYLRAEHTDVWVRRLYEGLRQSAPWRFAAALETHRLERHALGRPAHQPIVLFRLGGLNQQRRPCVALGEHAQIPTLCMVWTGSNAVLSRSLWERPPELTKLQLTTSQSDRLAAGMR